MINIGHINETATRLFYDCWFDLKLTEDNLEQACFITVICGEQAETLGLGLRYVPADRRLAIQANSLEKARRLHAHPEHFTSFATRDASLGRYGGAIRGRNEDQIISVSGFDECSDTALALLLGYSLKMTIDFANPRLAWSNIVKQDGGIEVGNGRPDAMIDAYQGLYPNGLFLA